MIRRASGASACGSRGRPCVGQPARYSVTLNARECISGLPAARSASRLGTGWPFLKTMLSRPGFLRSKTPLTRAALVRSVFHRAQRRHREGVRTRDPVGLAGRGWPRDAVIPSPGEGRIHYARSGAPVVVYTL